MAGFTGAPYGAAVHINDFHAAAGKAGNDGFLFEVLDCPRQCSAMDAEHGSELFLRHAERELIGTPFKAEGNEKAAETGDEIIHEHVSEIRMVGEDQRAEQLDNGKHEVGIPGGESGIMQYLSGICQSRRRSCTDTARMPHTGWPQERG